MKLNDYFEHNKGTGVLSTANADGQVDAAIYARPHFIDENTIAFIARERLTHANLQTNPSAVYLFKENNSYKGYRLYLTKLREEKDSPLIDEIRRRRKSNSDDIHNTESKFLIYFHIDTVLPLIGDAA